MRPKPPPIPLGPSYDGIAYDTIGHDKGLHKVRRYGS